MTEPDQPLGLYLVRYICGGIPGARTVWAIDAAGASRHLRQHPSTYGLPHQLVVVFRVTRLDLRESSLA